MSRDHGRKVEGVIENVLSDFWVFDGQSPGGRSIDARHCDHPSGDSSVGVQYWKLEDEDGDLT
jgi:hypothetical protein